MLRYIEIVHKLEKIIAQLKPGDKLHDRNQLSKELETSRSTLDKAIHELCNRGLLSSRKGSGTYVASSLDSLTAKEENWCVIVPDIRESIYSTLISGVEHYASDHNINIIVCNSNGNPVVQHRFIRRLLSNGIAGFIIVPVIQRTVQENYDLYSVLVRSKVPFVFCNRTVDGVPAPVVTSNDFFGAYLATTHLIKQGYLHIAFLAEQNYRTSMDRCQGYLTALLENNIPIDRQLIIMPEYSVISNQTYIMFEKLLDSSSLDAVFCFNDIVASKVYDILKSKSIHISDELGIIGYDDTITCLQCSPTLSSVSYKTYEIGQKAADVLYKNIHYPDQKSTFDYYLFQPEIKIRNSCMGKKQRSKIQER